MSSSCSGYTGVDARCNAGFLRLESDRGVMGVEAAWEA